MFEYLSDNCDEVNTLRSGNVLTIELDDGQQVVGKVFIQRFDLGIGLSQKFSIVIHERNPYVTQSGVSHPSCFDVLWPVWLWAQRPSLYAATDIIVDTILIRLSTLR